MKLRCRSSSARRVAVGAMVLAGLLAGCGVGNDASPRDIGANETPYTIVPTSVAPATTAPTNSPKVYMIGTDGVHLVASSRDASSRDALLVSLLGPATTQDNDRGLKTFIPIGTALEKTTISKGILTLYLLLPSGTSFEGPNAQKAFAQLVFTAAQQSDVSGVLFQINGEAVQPFDATGKRLKGPATPLDYAQFAPVGLGPDIKTPGSVATTTTVTPITNPPTTTTTSTTAPATTAAAAATTGS